MHTPKKYRLIVPLLAFAAHAFGWTSVDVQLSIPVNQTATVQEGETINVESTAADNAKGVNRHWIEQQQPEGTWKPITPDSVKNKKQNNKVQSVTFSTVGTFPIRAVVHCVSDPVDVLEYSTELKIRVTPKPKPTDGQLFSATLGPTWAELNPNAADTRPRLYTRDSKPNTATIDVRINPYEVSGAAGPHPDSDYWSSAGQVAYKQDKTIPNDPGLNRIQTMAYYSHCFALSARDDMSAAQYGIEPFTTGYWFDGVNVQLTDPICCVRNEAMLSNEELVIYGNRRFLGVAGTQTGRGGIVGLDWPLKGYQFEPDKMPSAMALTTSNEILLVALHDQKTGKGQIAVIACEGKLLAFHTWPWIALPNQGSWSDFVLLGYVDLPFAYPSSIAAASNGFWRGPSATNNKVLGQIVISDQGTRWGLRQGELGWSGIIASGGYAIVASKTENKVAILDLSPVFKYIRNAWLSDTEQPKTIAARAAGTWPQPLAGTDLPAVVWQTDIVKPTCVLAGHLTDRWSFDRHKAYVSADTGKDAGTVSIIDTSSLMQRYDFEAQQAGRGPVGIIGSVQVGANPVSLCFARYIPTFPLALMPKDDKGNQRQPDPLDNLVHVTCRGSADVRSLVTFQGKGEVYQTISDPRIVDPVFASVSDRCNVMSIADYNGKQVVNVRIGPVEDRVDGWGQHGEVFGCGADGTARFEITGFYPVHGNPFHVMSSNVN